jgi:ribosome-binding factor A
MKYRLQRVSELIKRELGDLFTRELSFGGALVTVNAVDVTADLKNAHVYVSVIGSEEQKAAVFAELAAHRKELQHLLSRRVIMKFTPHLHFKLDESVERGTHIIQLLDEIDIPPDDTTDEK